MKIFRLCRPYLSSHKYMLMAYIALMLLSTATAIAAPYVLGDFIDNLISGAGVNSILRFSIIFATLSMLRIGNGYITSLMHIKLLNKMSYSLNMDCIRHIHALSLSYSTKKDSAYLNQRINNDAGSLIGFCISVLQNAAANLIMLAVVSTILAFMHFGMSMIMLGFLFLYALSYHLFKKHLYKVGMILRERYADYFSRLHEQLRHIKIIKINSMQTAMNERAEQSFEDFESAAMTNQKVNYIYNGLDGTISTIAQIVLFIVGGIQVLYGNFTIGMFTVFTSYFGMMLSASRYFFTLGAHYQTSATAYDRINEILSHAGESNGNKIIHGVNEIELRNIEFAYEDNADIISDIDLRLSKGNIYCIAGRNGAGKSTLITLLTGMYIDEFRGNICFDGTDIREIDMIETRKTVIGYAQQEPTLLSDTIRYNLCITEEPTEYIDLLNMRDFFDRHTLDFVINEANTNLSGGEKQKLAILKVLCKDSQLMIFDEPTSALDAESNKRFIAHLHKIKRDKIIIIVSHDANLCASCDEVVKFD